MTWIHSLMLKANGFSKLGRLFIELLCYFILIFFSPFTVDPAEQSLLNKLIRHNLVKNRNQVEVLQRDPNSPLFSVKTFEELRL